MRIDKYLWCTRYFKTRSIATEACKKGHIKMNGVSVKPSKDVFLGENIIIRKDQVNYQIEVLDIPMNRVNAKLLGSICLACFTLDYSRNCTNF